MYIYILLLSPNGAQVEEKAEENETRRKGA